MILLVNAANRAAFADLLDEMFRARHEVFVELKGWEELRSPDGRETDAFDRWDSVYLIVVEDGEVRAGARLTGADGPTLAGTLLPELFEGDPPRGDDLLELSRLFNRSSPMDPATPAVLGLLAASAEFTRMVGTRGVLMLVELPLIQAMLSWGAHAEPLGLPRRTRDGTLMAAMNHASEVADRNLRRAMGLEGALLWWADQPGNRLRTVADILRIAPSDPDWAPPGDWTPLQRSALSPQTLAEAYWRPKMT